MGRTALEHDLAGARTTTAGGGIDRQDRWPNPSVDEIELRTHYFDCRICAWRPERSSRNRETCGATSSCPGSLRPGAWSSLNRLDSGYSGSEYWEAQHHCLVPSPWCSRQTPNTVGSGGPQHADYRQAESGSLRWLALSCCGPRCSLLAARCEDRDLLGSSPRGANPRRNLCGGPGRLV